MAVHKSDRAKVRALVAKAKKLNTAHGKVMVAVHKARRKQELARLEAESLMAKASEMNAQAITLDAEIRGYSYGG